MIEAPDERHRQFDRIRGREPVYLDPATGIFVLTRMADARAWLSDPTQWKDADQAEEGSLIRLFKPANMNRPGDRNSGIGWMDEPDHARVRQPIQAALVRRTAALQPAVEAIVAAQLDRLDPAGFDALADYAHADPGRGHRHAVRGRHDRLPALPGLVGGGAERLRPQHRPQRERPPATRPSRASATTSTQRWPRAVARRPTT